MEIQAVNESAAPAVAGDLDSVGDIAEMVCRFYQDVAQDELLGPLFNDVAEVDWAEHLPKLTAFWCRALLGISGYRGNPFQAHAEVHARHPLAPEHFDRWLGLFRDTIESGWTGPNAERALELADNVARVHRTQLTGKAASEAGLRPGGQAARPDLLANHPRTDEAEIR